MAQKQSEDFGECLEALGSVVQQCIDYVGRANYPNREYHAKAVARRAIKDFTEGKKPYWYPETEPY